MTRRPRSVDLPKVGHKAPIPLGARVGNLLCSSAINGKNPETGALPEDGTVQVANAFANLKALLSAGDAVLADVVRLTVTLSDDRLRDVLNHHWLECFPDPADRPARHTVSHPLAHGMAVQLELLAVIQDR